MKWILLGIVILTTSYAQTQTFELGVQDLRNDGIKQNEANIISERLREQFSNRPEYKVLDRSNMSAILEEQGFQESGACDGDQCQIEMGKILGVEFLVLGQVGQIGSMYVLSIKLVNIETSEVVATASKDYTGPIEKLLTEVVPQLVENIYQKHVKGQEVDLAPPGAAPTLQDPVSNLKTGSSDEDGIILPYVAYTLGVAAIGYGFYEQGNVDSAHEAYSDVQTGGDFNKAWNQVEAAKSRRNIGYALGGVLLATGLTVQVAF